ncbi:MAG: hypothetical protein ACKO46_00790 [Alphaproteobacteria bacterium]
MHSATHKVGQVAATEQLKLRLRIGFAVVGYFREWTATVFALAHKVASQVVVALATAISTAKDDLLYNTVKAKIIKNNFNFENKNESFIKN